MVPQNRTLAYKDLNIKSQPIKIGPKGVCNIEDFQKRKYGSAKMHCTKHKMTFSPRNTQYWPGKEVVRVFAKTTS